MLQLTIGRVGKVGRSVSHQHQCLIRCPGRQPREQRVRRLGIVLLPVQQGLPHPDIQLLAEGLQLRQQLFIFFSVHHMGWLHRNVGIALFFQLFHGPRNGIDLHSVPSEQLLHDDGAGKRPANLPARERIPDGRLHGQNIVFQCILIGGSKGNNQNRFFHALSSLFPARIGPCFFVSSLHPQNCEITVTTLSIFRGFPRWAFIPAS